MARTYFTRLRCSKCSLDHSPAEVQTVCRRCGKALLAEYDLDAARTALSPAVLAHREGTLWRYRELLPVFDEASVVSLGEGWTPVVHLKRFGREAGHPHIYLKEESLNPTGSFKARGMSVAVSKLKELGIREAAVPSAGNAGGALAAYAAKAGIAAHIFMPNDTPSMNKREVLQFGGTAHLVDGVISDAAKAMASMRGGTDWFDMSTMKEPYRLEGKKTMGYELAEQFAWRLPGVIVYPTGGGTGLIGMWKAFLEMEQLGWLEGNKPKMVSVQAEGCAPIVKAFRENKNESEYWDSPRTAASGLKVPKAFADEIILDILRASGGTAVAVTDEELLSDMKHLASTEGIFLCPEGAAAIGAVRRLLKEGFIGPDEKVVVFNTGSGYKYVELLANEP